MLIYNFRILLYFYVYNYASTSNGTFAIFPGGIYGLMIIITV